MILPIFDEGRKWGGGSPERRDRGVSTLAIAHDAIGDSFWGFEHVSRRYPHHLDPLTPQPRIAPHIVFRLVSHVVHDPVDFKCDLGLGAVEIEYVVTDRVLGTEVDAVARSFEQAPEQGFG